MDFSKEFIIVISVILTVSLLIIGALIPLKNPVHWYIYGKLLRLEHAIRPLPSQISDITLGTIDNNTLNTMAERWPYPRSCFAKVIDNLKKAGAKAIGFDFVFYGSSTEEEKELFRQAIGSERNVVLGAGIDEEGRLSYSTAAELKDIASSGLVTKLQDNDGVIRKCPTYFVKHSESKKGFLSWELLLMRAAKELDMNSLESEGKVLSFEKSGGQPCRIPVEADTKAFIIHYRANTVDFNRISFVSVFNGNFDQALVRDKIVICGLVSALLQDVHNTPFGWLPGVTLNANTFLNVYSGDFLREVPAGIEIALIFLCVAALPIAKSFLRRYISILSIAAFEILVFFILSYILLVNGYVWNYFIFPFVIAFTPALCKKFPHGWLKL